MSSYVSSDFIHLDSSSSSDSDSSERCWPQPPVAVFVIKNIKSVLLFNFRVFYLLLAIITRSRSLTAGDGLWEAVARWMPATLPPVGEAVAGGEGWWGDQLVTTPRSTMTPSMAFACLLATILTIHTSSSSPMASLTEEDFIATPLKVGHAIQ